LNGAGRPFSRALWSGRVLIFFREQGAILEHLWHLVI
jgi:hypothetical protein